MRRYFPAANHTNPKMSFAGGSEGETEPHRAVVDGKGVGPAGGRQSSDHFPKGYQRGGYSEKENFIRRFGMSLPRPPHHHHHHYPLSIQIEKFPAPRFFTNSLLTSSPLRWFVVAQILLQLLTNCALASRGNLHHHRNGARLISKWRSSSSSQTAPSAAAAKRVSVDWAVSKTNQSRRRSQVTERRRSKEAAVAVVVVPWRTATVSGTGPKRLENG